MAPTNPHIQPIRRAQGLAYARSLPDPRIPDDAALLERLMKMRAACEGLAAELASTRRRLRTVERELDDLKRPQR